MKILSTTFVTESEVPNRTRDTESMKVARELGEALKRQPEGKVSKLSVKMEKWERFALQRRLQRLGYKVQVIQIDDNTIAIKRVKDETPATKK